MARSRVQKKPEQGKEPLPFDEKQSLKVALTKWKAMEGIKVKPEPQRETIGFVNTVCGDSYRSGKSGPINCVKGFKVVFSLLQPRSGWSDWCGTFVFLIDHRIPVDQCRSKVDSLDEKQDPNVPAYGVYTSPNWPCNLKVNSSGSPLPHTEPITVEYDREAQTVKFTSKNFDYSQTGVPKDVTFAVGVTLS